MTVIQGPESVKLKPIHQNHAKVGHLAGVWLKVVCLKVGVDSLCCMNVRSTVSLRGAVNK